MAAGREKKRMLGREANARSAPALSSRATLWSGHRLAGQHMRPASTSSPPSPNSRRLLLPHAHSCKLPSPMALAFRNTITYKGPTCLYPLEAGRKKPREWSSAKV